MTIANQITFTSKPDQERDLKTILNTLVTQALLEKGCQKFELYQLSESRQEFFIVEIWKSDKSYQTHLKQEAYKKLLREIEDLCSTQIIHPLKLTQCLTKLGLKSKKEEKK